MDRRLGVGVLGLHEGRTMLLGLEGRARHCRAVAGCDLQEEKLAAVRGVRPDLFYTTRYEDLLAHPEVDIVSIFTPDQYHGQHIVQAFEAGKDVMCTKPVVNSVEDARRVLEAARRCDRLGLDTISAGATIAFEEVLMVGEGDNATVGTPLVAGASVRGTVLDQTRGEKIIVFKKKRRKNYRRRTGHRQDISVVRITEIARPDAA